MKTKAVILKAVILDVSQVTIVPCRILVEDEESFNLIANYLSSTFGYSNAYDESRKDLWHGYDIISSYQISNENIEIIKSLVDDYRLFTLYSESEIPNGFTGWVRSQNIKWEE